MSDNQFEDQLRRHFADLSAEPPVDVARITGLGRSAKRRRRFAAIGGVALAVIVVVVATVLVVQAIQRLPQWAPGPVNPAVSSPSPPAPATSDVTPGTWSQVVTLNNLRTVADSGLDDIVLAKSSTAGDAPCTITAFDVANLAQLWQTPTGATCDDIIPSSQGIVAVQYPSTGVPHAEVIDPRTGAVTAQSDLTAGEKVTTVGGGMVYTQTSTTGCARTMALGPCIWQAPVTYTPCDGNEARDIVGLPDISCVFGDYSWIITGDGVQDFHTGALAPFGADATTSAPSPDATTYSIVSYVGATKDHVLRKVQVSDGPITYQRWDATANTGIGSPIEAEDAAFSADSPTFVVSVFVSNTSDGTQERNKYVGYSWTTGQQVFTTDPSTATYHWPTIVGNALWSLEGDASMMSQQDLEAFSLTSGNRIWTGSSLSCQPYFVGATTQSNDSTAYTTCGDTTTSPTQLEVIDTAVGRQLPNVDLPVGTTAAVVAGNRVIAYDAPARTLWVLQQ